MRRKAIPKKLKQQVRDRYGGRCGYCGTESDRLHVDHIVPVRRGGPDTQENLMPACPACNNYKHSFSLEGFRRQLSQQVNRARKNSINFRLAEKYRQITVQETTIIFYFEDQ